MQPPITFQPPPPLGPPVSSIHSAASRAAERPSQPDLITRYRLKDRVGPETTEAEVEEETDKKGKGWSSNREERQTSLQKRRDEMILAARRKMEAKIAAEKSAVGGS